MKTPFVLLIIALTAGQGGSGLASGATNATQVLARHFAAAGGQTALENVETMLVKATKADGLTNVACEVSLKRPGKVLLKLEQEGTVVRQARDGRARFWQQDKAGVRDLPGADAGTLMGLASGWFVPGQLFWTEMLSDAVVHEERLGDRDVVVLGRNEGGFPLLSFDQKSGLLVKIGEWEFSDYRPVESIQVPFEARRRDGARFQVRAIVLNPPLQDGIFERPKIVADAARSGSDINFETLISSPGKLEIMRRPPPANFGRGPLAALPKYESGSGRHGQVDLRGYDLSRLDLRSNLVELLHADFDQRTRWPANLPAGFDRDRIEALGKNPGLQVRQLHQRGITGRGVAIGIIDQALLVDHSEYADRLRLYEEIHLPQNSPAQMHGPAVASIAVGKTLGVAPEAELYYIAEMHGNVRGPGNEFEWDFAPLAQSIERLLDVNRTLPVTGKLRVISISVGWTRGQKGATQADAAVERARKDGVFVISTALEQTHRLAFHGLGREALSDPDDANSFGPGSWWAQLFWGGQQRFGPGKRLLVPMDARCTASPTGPDEYVYYSTGGWSWSVPWIAGLYALCCQVKPQITPDQFWAEALETGRVIHLKHDKEELDLGTIADPIALVARLAGANLR